MQVTVESQASRFYNWFTTIFETFEEEIASNTPGSGQRLVTGNVRLVTGNFQRAFDGSLESKPCQLFRRDKS
jgi:hypothetical protein